MGSWLPKEKLRVERPDGRCEPPFWSWTPKEAIVVARMSRASDQNGPRIEGVLLSES